MGARVDPDCAVNTENHLEKEILDTRLNKARILLRSCQKCGDWILRLWLVCSEAVFRRLRSHSSQCFA